MIEITKKPGQAGMGEPEAGPIRLHRSGQYLEIAPPVEGLGDYIFTVRHLAVPDAEHGVRIEKYPYPLFWSRDLRPLGPCLECFAGLEPVVVTSWRRLGMRFC